MKETKGNGFNPKIGNGFSNDKFGEGSILVQLTTEGINSFVDNARDGSAILIKFNKVTSKGNKHYFVELLPARPINYSSDKKDSKSSKSTNALD